MEENYLLRKGSRLSSNKVKIRLTKNGQYSMTVPKLIALATKMEKGSVVSFELLKYGGIKLNIETTSSETQTS